MDYILKYREKHRGPLTVKQLTDKKDDLTIDQALALYDLKFKINVVDATLIHHLPKEKK